jgi:hypothetical protein
MATHDVTPDPMGYATDCPHRVSLEVISAAMAPEYLPSDRLVIDLDMTPAPGDTVIAEVSGAMLLRRYWPNVDGTFRLTAVDRSYPATDSDCAAATMLGFGVVVELRRSARPAVMQAVRAAGEQVLH